MSVRQLKLWAAVAFFAFSPFLEGCTSGALETEPVNLPVPFSGALTADTAGVVEDGEPVCEGKVAGHFSGCAWELVDGDGKSVGTIRVDLASIEEAEIEGDQRTFRASVTFLFNDGSICKAPATEFIQFPLDIPASFDPVSVSGEADAAFRAFRGVASGAISSGTGLCANAVGRTVDARFVQEAIAYADGTIGYFVSNRTVWLVHGLQGGVEP